MKETNKIVTRSLSVLCIILIVGFLINQHQNQLPILDTVIIVLPVAIALIATLYAYSKEQYKDTLKNIVFLTSTLVYAVLILFSRNDFMYMIGFIFVIVYFLYFDLTLIKRAGIAFTLINIVSIILCVISGTMPSGIKLDVTSLYLQVASIVTFFTVSYVTAALFNSINDSKINDLKLSASTTNDLLMNVLYSVDSIQENVEVSTKLVQDVNTANQKLTKLVSKIDKQNSTNTTNVMNQLDTCNKVTSLINTIATDVTDTIEISNNAFNELNISNSKLQELETLSTDIMSYNHKVIESINKFIEKTNDVKEITSGILDISNQTNSLAINAAIESARSGEAGKGFAIVSTQIRSLADQTKKLTSEISNVISFLEKNATDTGNVVFHIVKSINEENYIIEHSKTHFNEINDNITQLNIAMNNITETTNDIIQYNAEINTHVNDLVKTTSEVANNTITAAQYNDKAANIAIETMDSIEQLLNSTEKLNKYL